MPQNACNFFYLGLYAIGLALSCMAVSANEQITTTSDFDAFFEDGLYRPTEGNASQELWNARINFGEESVEAALAQINLAKAQQQKADYPAAIDNFEIGIRRIEAAEGIVSPLLVEPLMGLAASNNAMGAYDRGLVNYERALRLNHVDLGLYNDQQLPIRDELTETYLALGAQADAEFQQEIQLVILQQEFGADMDRVIPAFYKLAGWYERTNQPQKQAYQYQQAVRMIREQTDKNSPNQIEALRELSRTYYKMNMPAESMRMLKRAYRINTEAEEPDPLLAADIQVEIGDFYSLFGSRKDSVQHYQTAWNMLTTAEDQEELRDSYFSEPIFLQGPPLPTLYPVSPATRNLFQEQPNLFAEGFAIAEYDVDASGRVRNVRIIESEPAKLIDKKFRLSLTRQRYRPRLVDGAPVRTTGEQVRIAFNYEKQSNKAEKEGKPERLKRPGSADTN
ncbi:MAG: energy transducer TonB [Gammaproteobacteria bacterium]